MCPAGHRLQQSYAPAGRARAVICDRCNKQLPGGAQGFGCRACDYDVCAHCRSGKRVAAADAGSGGGGASGGDSASGANGGAEETWACPQCTLKNRRGAPRCTACKAAGPSLPKRARHAGGGAGGSSSIDRDMLVAHGRADTGIREGLMPLIRSCFVAPKPRPPGPGRKGGGGGGGASGFASSTAALTVEVRLAGALVPMFTQRERWSCGYRNLQMLFGALLRLPPPDCPDSLKKAIFGGLYAVPTIGDVQGWIELAWSHGFDQRGRVEFMGKLRGTQSWIGTPEVVALASSFGVRARLLTFLHPDGDMEEQSKLLLAQVWEYFGGDGGGGSGGGGGGSSGSGAASGTRVSIVHQSGKLPLYFQHQGHSRTIVGIERRRVPGGGGAALEDVLLLFDPSVDSAQLAEKLTQKTGWESMLKRTPKTLKKDAYQIVMLDPATPLSSSEQEEAKKNGLKHDLFPSLAGQYDKRLSKFG